MSALGNTIANVALSYVTPEDICYEVTSNKGNCIDELKCYYAGKIDYCAKSDIGSEAYCALSAWAWVDKAVKILDGKNLLPKTKGAYDMLNKSKSVNGLIVNKTPTIGSVFYRKSSATGSTGHVGIVVRLDGTKFHTVEANMEFIYQGKKYQGVWVNNYPYTDIPKRSFNFIHTEDMPHSSNPILQLAGGNPLMLIFGLIVVGGVVYGLYQLGK